VISRASATAARRRGDGARRPASRALRRAERVLPLIREDLDRFDPGNAGVDLLVVDDNGSFSAADISRRLRVHVSRALWKIQDRSFKVQTLRPAVEKELFDTNAQLRTDDPEAAASPPHTAPGAASVGGGV